MKLILLTKPEFFCGEAEIINRLFRHGLPTLHLRKPQAMLRRRTPSLLR